jgi:exodeoxyribonuclease VII large subunit
MHPATSPQAGSRMVWHVSGLLQAMADALQSRFNPVTVRGELSGFVQAASGHCYFSIKDKQSQLKCAMFRRAAAMVDFRPRDGDVVELRGRLDVYSARGELQLIVESMQRAGQGALMEQFLALKARLQAQGLFDAERKKAIPERPRHIAVVTSLQAAALRDVVSVLQRRAPHTPVTVFPASVQGERAVPELLAALQAAGAQFSAGQGCDVLLLVRGGGSLEDLWAFNDEGLALALAQMPMPVICGVGHETDFSIADFVADLRAPTPTAAAELCATDWRQDQTVIQGAAQALQSAVARQLERQAQRLDRAAQGLSRPRVQLARQASRLQWLGHQALRGVTHQLAQHQRRHTALSTHWAQSLANVDTQPRQRLDTTRDRFNAAVTHALERQRQRLALTQSQLVAMAPERVLARGYAWLQDDAGRLLTSASQVQPGQAVSATLSDGQLGLTVRSARSP